jgi:hypothetical protein
MKKFTWLLIIAFLVAGCSTAQQNTPMPATDTITLTATITSSPTPAPTSTATSIPMPTATLSYPLSAGTPLPSVSKIITTHDLSSLRETLFWWQNPASTMVFSQDQSLVALTTAEWVKIYDTKSNQLISDLRNVGNLSKFSPDNKRFLANGVIYSLDGTKIFNMASAENMSYSEDWKTVAVVKSCRDTGLLFKACETDVYDVDSNKMLSGFPGEDPILSPDGKYVAVTQDKFVYFRKTSNGKQMIQLNPDNYLMDNPTWEFSPDSSKIIIIHRDLFAGINILSLDEGKLLKTIYPNKTNTPNQSVHAAKISNNGSYLATFDGTNITVFEVATGNVASTELSPTDKDFTGVNDYGIPTFSSSEENENPTFTATETDVYGSGGTSIQSIQNLRFGADSNTLDFFTSAPNSNAQQYCTLSDNSNLKCSPQNGFLASDGNFYSVSAAPEKLTLFKNDNGTQQEIGNIDWKGFAPSDTSNLYLVGYSAGDNFIVLSGKKALILDMKKQKIAKQWYWNESNVAYSSLSPDGKYLAFTIKGQIPGSSTAPWDEDVFSFEKGEVVWSGGSKDTYLMAISPDSTRMVEMQETNGVSLFYYYNFIQNVLLRRFEMDNCNVTQAAISNDNSYVLLGCGGSIEAMNPTNGDIFASLPAFNSEITSIAISKDGSRIAAGSSDGFILVISQKRTPAGVLFVTL